MGRGGEGEEGLGGEGRRRRVSGPSSTKQLLISFTLLICSPLCRAALFKCLTGLW